MISTTTLTIDTVSKTGRLTDTTDYVGLFLSLASFNVKGLGIIYFQGQQIVSKLTIGDPLIDLATGDTYFDFPLELDVNGEIANGVYQVDYSLYIDTTAAFANFPITITPPSSFDMGGAFSWAADFLEEGDLITLYTTAPVPAPQVVTVSTAVYTDPVMLVTVDEVISDPTYPFFRFTITNLQSSNTYTYAGCTQADACIAFNYDCDVAPNGTFAVSNATIIPPSQTISTLTANISYPSWTASQVGFNPQISNVPLPYTNNVLATGTYTVVMNQVIEQVQEDGLIIVYSANTTGEFKVSCVGSLCGLNSCIDSLRSAHAAELQRNRISKYQVFVDNVLMYYIEAQTYRSCGDADAYRTSLANLQAQLDASGCDCGCCDDDVYTWVSVNSSATIESLIEAIQYRLKTGVPNATDDETVGVQVGAIWQDVTTGILHRCTNNNQGAATWAVYYDPSAAANVSNGLSTSGSDIVLGGFLTGNTTINTTTFNFKLSSSANVAPLLVESSGTVAAMSVRKTTTSPTTTNVTDITRVYAPSGGNGLGARYETYLSDVTGTEALASFAITYWEDSTNKDSSYELGTSNGGSTSTRLTILPDGQLRLNNYSTANFPDPAPVYSLGVDASGNVVQTTPSTSSGPLVYVARLFQSGTLEPTATEIANTTGATFTFLYDGVGRYRLTASTPVFTTGKTAAFLTAGTSGITTQAYMTSATITGVATCLFGTSQGFFAGGADDLLKGATLKIEIYP